MLIDIGPLRHNTAFRHLFASQFISGLGTMVSYVAVPWQLYELTQSNAQVGLLGLVQLVPVVGCGLLGGAVADRVDRKRLLLTSEALMALCLAGLLLNATDLRAQRPCDLRAGGGAARCQRLPPACAGGADAEARPARRICSGRRAVVGARHGRHGGRAGTRRIAAGALGRGRAPMSSTSSPSWRRCSTSRAFRARQSALSTRPTNALTCWPILQKACALPGRGRS
ncbi:MAG: MFS transporter [Nitrospira sp.]